MSNWFGDPFRETNWSDPDPNERIIFGDNEIPREEEEEPETTGNQQDDKMLQVLTKILKHTAPQEHKWINYPTFNGTQDPYEWITRFDSACAINRVKNGRRLELLDGVLEGPALAWWRSVKHKCKRFGGLYDREKDPQESFKYWFINQYCGPDKQYEWMIQIRQLKQAPGETVSSYATKLKDLYFRADPRKRYPEYDALNQFIEGLRPELRKQTRMALPSTLEEAINKAKAAELAYSDGGPLAAYSLASKDNAVAQELRELKTMMATAYFTQAQDTCDLCYKQGHKAADCPNRSMNRVNQPKQKSCYNCHQIGHFSKDCPKRNKCYICNKNHATIKCPVIEGNKTAQRIIYQKQQNKNNRNNTRKAFYTNEEEHPEFKETTRDPNAQFVETMTELLKNLKV